MDGWMEQGREATIYIYIIYHGALAASTLIILFSEIFTFLKKTFLSKYNFFVKETREYLVYLRVLDFFGHGIFKIN